jgi:hypothetical protein
MSGFFLEPRKPVERALQDESGGVLIDHSGALGAADIGCDQFAFNRNGREPFVPQCDRQLSQFCKIARKGARGLRTRPFAAVHIERQAEHNSGSRSLGRECKHAPCVGSEGCASDCLDARREFSIRIARSDADRLGSEIKANECAASGQVRGGFNQRQDDGHAQAVPWGSIVANAVNPD